MPQKTQNPALKSPDSPKKSTAIEVYLPALKSPDSPKNPTAVEAQHNIEKSIVEKFCRFLTNVKSIAQFTFKLKKQNCKFFWIKLKKNSIADDLKAAYRKKLAAQNK